MLLLAGWMSFSGLCLAQTEPGGAISLSGTIVDETDAPVPYVTISVLNRNEGVVSNAEGFFFLRFDRQDTLELSALGFEKQQLYLGDTATADNYDVNIRLSEKTYTLENITVLAYKDEEAFRRAILALDEKDLPKETPKIRIPGSYEGPHIEKRPGAASPLSFLYDRFSKRARYEREARQAQQDYDYRKKLSGKYNRDLVGKVTGLQDEQLEEFMAQCRLEDTFIEKSNEYEIILAINQCYEDFKVR